MGLTFADIQSMSREEGVLFPVFINGLSIDNHQLNTKQ
jgi:hypothetical protein